MDDSSSETCESRPYRMGDYFDERYKIVIIGSSAVGKSSIIRCWAGDPFLPSLTYTIGFDVFERLYDFPSGTVRLSVWDTAGQERFNSICRNHYRGAKALIFVYDVTNMETFKLLTDFWLREVDESVDEDSIPIFVVGNKTDLVKERKVTVEEGQEFATCQGAYGLYETSAKLGEGVNEMFCALAETIVSTWGLQRRCKMTGNEDVCCLDGCKHCGRTHQRKSIVEELDLGTSKEKGKCCSG